MKRSPAHVIGEPEEIKRENRAVAVFEETMAWNF